MVFATLMPLGVIQLYHSVSQGYFEARELKFITQPGNALLEWLRMPGDIVMIVGGVLPFLWIAWLGVRHSLKQPTSTEAPIEQLFTEEHPVPAAVGAAAPAEEAAVDAPRSRYASDRRGNDEPGAT
jgi:nitric oxide reductase subunit B